MPSYKYKLVSSDNLDAFLEAIGYPVKQRRELVDMDVILEFCDEADDGYTLLTTHYGSKSFTIRYKVGVEYEYDHPDGSKIKALVTKDGGGHTFTTVERHAQGYELKKVLEFDLSGLKKTSTVKGVTTIQVFQKI